MTVKVRPYKRGGWEVDIMLTFPGRRPIRERRKTPLGTKSAARRWGEERERQLLEHYASTDPDDDPGRPKISKEEVPTLATFAPRYIEGHCKANRLRPATICAKDHALKNHLIPAFGNVRLDRITTERLQRFKAERSDLKGSTVNVLLSQLLAILNVAVEWGVIDKVPAKPKRLKEDPSSPKFYDVDEFDRLVLAAEQCSNPNTLLTVLLGGEAGLRCSEMMGLRWADIDLKRDLMTVQRAVWRRQEGPPKGGRARTVPLAERLRAALVEHRHLRSPYVLITPKGTPPGSKTIRVWLNHAQARAKLKETGPHILRHTFCSHLAMAGKPARAIQELAGHQSIQTTELYMHLAPGAARDAIDALRRPPNWRRVGDGRSTVIELQ